MNAALKTFCPKISIKSVSIGREDCAWEITASQAGVGIGLGAEVGFCRAFAKPKGILGFGDWDSEPRDRIWLPRASLRCGRTKGGPSGRSKGYWDAFPTSKCLPAIHPHFLKFLQLERFFGK